MRQSSFTSDTKESPAAGPLDLQSVSDKTDAVSRVCEQVLIVDSDMQVCRRLGTLLERHGISVRCFHTAQSLLDVRLSDEVGCLVIEVELPDMDGVALLERLNQQGRSVPAIVVASGGDVPTAVRAIRAKAVDFFEKPVIENLLLKCIRQVLGTGVPSPD